ncbi:MAG: restriction endonuclease subunit S [Reyranella sp.]|nr:restriction endonuclease subunit S [Reyranella sp.]
MARRGVMGRCAVVTSRQAGFLCGTGSMIVRPEQDRLLPHFLQRYLSSPDVIDALEEGAVGTTMVNLNQSILLRQRIPLPTLSEQTEIVRRIDSAFAWIDRLTAEATGARNLINRLDQAVLAKAFRGELVPPDPKDEPASLLLDRVRAERQGSDDGPSRRHRKSS